MLQRRNSLRYTGHDYSSSGGYFVTVRLQDAWHLLGEVEEGRVDLSAAGRMVHEVLDGLPAFIPSIAMDAFIVMPNHIHVLLFLGADPETAPPSLGSVVSRIKSITANRYIDGVKKLEWPRFNERLWQRDFYDHIVRSERGVEKIREYIESNPSRWQAKMDSMRIRS